VGFGVRDAASAVGLAARADGVVVGSALVEAVRKSDGDAVAAVTRLVRELAKGVAGAKRHA
jgi:tryptophan synthase alpha chain